MSQETYRFQADPEATGQRLDHFLTKQEPFFSRSRIQRLIEKGMVAVNAQQVRPSYRMRANDLVEVTVPPPEEVVLAPEPIPLDIVYEDGDLLVVNKPAGLVVHPAVGHFKGTLVNALLEHCPDLPGIGGYLRPGIVHRLDKDTSGLLLVSKSDLAHQGLSAQLKARQIKRKYLALVYGEVRHEQGLIDAPLGRDPRDRKKIAVIAGGREARTFYRIRERFSGYTLLDVELETGRTHQIRVHLAYAGHPVAGDPVYGPRPRYPTQRAPGTRSRGRPVGRPVPDPEGARWGAAPAAAGNPLNLPGQALHAYRIAFTHPRTSEPLSVEAALPPVFSEILNQLRCLSDS